MGKECNEKRSYETEADAKATADHQKQVNNLDFYAYLCKACGKWHLAMEKDRINHKISYCTDSNGNRKQCYTTEEDALKVLKNQPAHIRHYYCSTCDGWHLTHR